MLAKRNKFNLSDPQNREKLRSFQQSFSRLFSIRFEQSNQAAGMVVVGKKVARSAVKRNAIKRACYEVLANQILMGDKRIIVVRVLRETSVGDVKKQLSSQVLHLT